MAPVALDDIRAARERIRGFVLTTPLIEVHSVDLADGNHLWLKAENLQRTGSFKIRGAYNAISCLSEEDQARGVITYSSGNHGQAVACAAHALHTRAVVVMPEDAIRVKVEATRRWEAEVVFAGLTSLARQERALELARENDYVVIPPFDHQAIIAGQGTAGLELLEQLPEVEVVAIPVGGGGLLGGMATAIKSVAPHVRVVGVEPENAADARDSFRQGRVTTWQHVDTVSDGLRTSRVGDLNFAAIRQFVDDIVTVSEEEILYSVALLSNAVKVVAEPSGATAPAAALFGRLNVRNSRVAALMSGGNIAADRLASCVAMASVGGATVATS